MHELIYEQFLEASIYTELIGTKICDSEGNMVNNEENMVRLPIKYKPMLPNYLLIVDKVGSNLHCDNNKDVSREKYILSIRNDDAIIRSNNNNYKFTLLVFTSTDRQPVVCV